MPEAHTIIKIIIKTQKWALREYKQYVMTYRVILNINPAFSGIKYNICLAWKNLPWCNFFFLTTIKLSSVIKKFKRLLTLEEDSFLLCFPVVAMVFWKPWLP